MGHDPVKLAEVTLRMIEAGRRVLATRILTLLSLLAAGAMFAAADAMQTWLSFAVACAFCALVFLPCLSFESRTQG